MSLFLIALVVILVMFTILLFFKFTGWEKSVCRFLLSEKGGGEERERLSYLRFLENMERIDGVIRKAEDLEEMMANSLDMVLSIFECDRSWLLYPCDPEAPSWTVPMERTRKEYPGALARKVEIAMLPEARELFQIALASNGPVTCHSQGDLPLPPEASKQFNIRSQMFLALYPKRGKAWIFGLHQCSHERIWTEEEKRLFKEIGRRIADSLSSLLFLREQRKIQENLAISLEEKKILLAEVHHRVKNNLAIISSLLSLQSRYITESNALEALKECRDRIRSMSLVHEHLYKSKNFVSIDLREYLESLIIDLKLSYSGETAPVRFLVEVGNITLSMDVLIPGGLIINELITNALKHAFKNTAHPEVKIHWEWKEEERRVEFSVRDNGCGLPEEVNFENPKTLGLQLVKILVEQLKGTLEFIRDEGTGVLISFYLSPSQMAETGKGGEVK